MFVKKAVKIFRKSVLKKKKSFSNTPQGLQGRSIFEDVMKEAELHLKLDHPNIIKLIKILDDTKKDKLYFCKNKKYVNWLIECKY